MSSQRLAFRDQMDRSPLLKSLGGGIQRLRRAVSSPPKSDASGIGWVSRCMGLHVLHGLHGALGHISRPPFCANQQIPCKGRYRHIRQSANLGTRLSHLSTNGF